MVKPRQPRADKSENESQCQQTSGAADGGSRRQAPLRRWLVATLLRSAGSSRANPGLAQAAVSWQCFSLAAFTPCGRVAELADAQDLGSCGAIRAGSTPVAPTVHAQLA